MVLDKATEEASESQKLKPTQQTLLYWDDKPKNFSVFQHRKIQVQKYIQEHPMRRVRKF